MPTSRAYLAFDFRRLPNTDSLALLIRYQGDEPATQGTLRIDSTSDGQTWDDSVWSKTSNMGQGWHLAVLNLPPGATRIRFSTLARSAYNDIAIDDVVVSNAPTPAPTMTRLPTPFALPDTCVTLNMLDSWGDGWDGAAWTWAVADGSGEVESGTHASGASSTAPLCGPAGVDFRSACPEVLTPMR